MTDTELAAIRQRDANAVDYGDTDMQPEKDRRSLLAEVTRLKTWIATTVAVAEQSKKLATENKQLKEQVTALKAKLAMVLSGKPV